MADDTTTRRQHRQGRPPAKRSGGTGSGARPGGGRPARASGGSGASGRRRALERPVRRRERPAGGVERTGPAVATPVRAPRGGTGGAQRGRGGSRRARAADRVRDVGPRPVARRRTARPQGSAERWPQPRSGRARRRGATASDAPERGGGFGPYAVDRRDEDDPRAARHAAPRRRRARRTGGRARSVRRCAPSASGTDRRTPKPRQSRAAPSRERPGAAAGASAARPTCSRSWPGSPAATPTVPSARSWPRPTPSPHDREREALRILRPLREQLPDSPSVRELTGLCQYRIGNYAAAAKELEAYADLSDSVDQHPVLMDCYRAQRRWRKVEELWQELAAVSPSARARGRGPHRLRRRARRPGPPARGARACCASGPSGSRSRRSTTCGSGTRSPTSRSGPATSPGPASCSTEVRARRPVVRRRRRAPRRASDELSHPRRRVAPSVLDLATLPRTRRSASRDRVHRRKSMPSTSAKPSACERRVAEPVESPA